MKALRYLSLAILFPWVGAVLFAQATVPAINQAIGAQTLVAGGAPVSIDLRTIFTLPGVSGQIAQFDTVVGKFNVELLASDAPVTVQNFLNYVNEGDYSNSLIHRSVVNFVIQGGGFNLMGNTVGSISKSDPIQNEFKIPNTRGTLAMAKIGPPTGQAPTPETINSATNEWFVNLADNRAILDGQNGGFTVFARVLGTGMSVVDAIAALQTYDVRQILGAAFGTTPLRAPALTADTLVLVRSITLLPIYPPTNDATSVIGFTATSDNASVATAAFAGSTIAVTPRAAGNANITVRAIDTNGNSVESTFAASVIAGPAFTAQPESQSVTVAGTVVLNAGATGASSYQWTRNGVNISGATSSTLTISNVQPEHAGIYVALAGNGSVTSASRPAIVGVRSNEKVVGAAEEIGPDIKHPNGLTYDQIVLQGAAATVRADPGQVLRISYLDTSEDIVQVEFAGAGNLTLMVDDPTPPAPPAKYIQPASSYVKGRGTIILAGADSTTNVTVFSVGRGTALNQGLFRDDVTYDGMADIACIAIASTDGNFGGVRAANTRFSSARGFTGLYAPGVRFVGPVNIGDISATDSATPAISLASVAAAKLTGGDLFQENARGVQVEGLARLEMTTGTDSHNRQQPPQAVRGRLERDGADVTNEVVVPAN